MAKTKKTINREISWLHFNGRVLQEAMDVNNPLIERLRFLGIFSNNRDEFFRVRVATLRRLIGMEKNRDQNLGFVPEKILKEAMDLVAVQERRYNETFTEIRKQLQENHIFFVDETKPDEEQGRFVRQFFTEYLRPFLFPIMLKNLESPEFLRDKFIYLAVVLHDSSGNQEDEYAIIMVPTHRFSRFLLLPDSGGNKYIMMLEDVIRFGLKEVFKSFDYDTFTAYTIKFTRDAELDIDNDFSKSFYELMSESLEQRKKGLPVRFVYDNQIPPVLLKQLLKRLRISEDDSLRGGGRYHNFRDFIGFPNLGDSSLIYPEMKPMPHPLLKGNTNILKIIRQRDVMLHYPYQSFQYLVDLLREASIDPQVRAIKMTFYRAARNSNVINALINAARNGKKVTVFLEIQARFDEKANIYWAGRLKEEGVKIIKNLPGYKVHAKLMLIRRKEEGENIYYSHISTGNFNESTARIYADDGLFTANKEIGKEVNMLFHLLESPYTPPRFKHFLVAPYYMRRNIIRLLNNEIKNAKAGREAWAIIKMNSLVDRKLTRKLSQASGAGVKIQIICRGICVLVPGISEFSENIEIVGVVDKFLEHSRLMVFANNNNPLYYLSSADWMIRNFDHRFEVACPIYDPEIQKEIMFMLRTQLSDNIKARLLNSDPINKYKTSAKDGNPMRSQFYLYDYFKKLSE